MAIYTCVLLDVDNTILDFDAAERRPMTDMLAEYELPHDEAAYDTYHKVNRELWDSLAKGQLNKQKLFQIRFSRFMQTMQLPDNGKGKAMNDRYEELLATHARPAARRTDRAGGAERGRHAGPRLERCHCRAGVPHCGLRHRQVHGRHLYFREGRARPSPAPSCLSMPSVTSASRTRAVC